MLLEAGMEGAPSKAAFLKSLGAEKGGKLARAVDATPQYSAGNLGGGKRTEVNPRRTNKIIAAVARGNPRLLMQDTVGEVSKDERTLFGTRVTSPEGNDALRAAITGVPAIIGVGERRDINKEAQVYKERFAGDHMDQTRMRGIIAFGLETKKERNAVTADDIYQFVARHPDALSFEQMIPRILREVGEKGINTYLPLIDNVGISLYGNQWVYLTQARLAQREYVTGLARQQLESRAQVRNANQAQGRETTSNQDEQERKRRLLGPIQPGQTFIHPSYGEISITEVTGSQGQELVSFRSPRQSYPRRPIAEVVKTLIDHDYLPTRYHSDQAAITVEGIDHGLVVYRIEGGRREPYREPIEAFRKNLESRGWNVGQRPGQQDHRRWMRRPPRKGDQR